MACAQKPELVVQTGHSHVIWSVDFSPDGRTLASGSFDGTIKLWDVASGRELQTLAEEERGIYSVAFSSDWRTLAVGSRGKITLWDVASGRELRTLTENTDDPALYVAFSPDGRTLASASRSHATIKLWDVASGRELQTLAEHEGVINSVAFSQDGRTLASGSDDRTIKLWDVANRRELRTLVGHKEVVYKVVFSPDGRTLASVGGQKTVKLWDVASGRELRTLAENTDSVVCVAFSPDGRTLAWGGVDATVTLWDLDSGRELRTLAGRTSTVLSIAFSPNGRTVASGSALGDATIRLWDVASGRELQTLAGRTNWVASVAFSPDGNTLASASEDRTIWLWDVATGTELRNLARHTGNARAVAFSSDGQTLASGNYDPWTIELWDVPSGHKLKTLVGCVGSVLSVAFSPDGHTLVAATADSKIKLWDVASGRKLRDIPAGWSVALSPDGRTLAGESAHTIKLWDVVSGRELRTLAGHSKYVQSVDFSPDGRTLAGGSADTIKLWDVASGRELRTLVGQKELVDKVVFSPDGRTLASGSHATIKLWDTESGRELRTLATGAAASVFVAFSPDGRTLASQDTRKAVKLWDVPTGRELVSLFSFADDEWIAITPEGYYKSSAKGDQYLNVRVGNHVYGIDQWRVTFDKPQVVEAALKKGDTRQAIASVLGNSAAADLTSGAVPEPPSIEIKSPTDGSNLSSSSANLAFAVEDAQKPIVSVSIFVNGRQVVGSGDREVKLQSPGANMTKLVIPSDQRRLERTVPLRLDPGSNRIEVSAFNGIAEARKIVNVSFCPPPNTAPSLVPNLWILAIGVNHYESPQFTSLAYAVEDAGAVAEAFAKQQGKVFGEVHTLLITDEGQLKPTHDNIMDNLNYLKKAGQFDIVVLFVAGHGCVDSSGDFYFLPNDAALDDEGELRRSRAVRWTELKSVLDVPAQKIVLLDACHSEGATGRKTRDVESDMLVRELQDTRGLIISSSRGKELSQESAKWKHGAFTYALLEGMGGKATSSHGRITLLALAEYVSRRVPELTNGAQHPITDTSGGYELFELVQLD